MDIRSLTRIFKALSNENRLELFLELLRQQEKGFERGHGCLVADIVHRLRVGAPTISHHLKELSGAGLIRTERQGKYILARIDEGTLATVRKILSLEHQ